jgi:Ni,Fe-hydrogenase maturation factor
VDPSQALLLASAVGVPPTKVYIVGCQPAEIREFTETLTPPVERAVDEAVQLVEALLGRILN